MYEFEDVSTPGQGNEEMSDSCLGYMQHNLRGDSPGRPPNRMTFEQTPGGSEGSSNRGIPRRRFQADETADTKGLQSVHV